MLSGVIIYQEYAAPLFWPIKFWFISGTQSKHKIVYYSDCVDFELFDHD